MIAFNQESARQYEESQKALGRWGSPKHAYTFGRILSIVGGSLVALLGALMLYGLGDSN